VGSYTRYLAYLILKDGLTKTQMQLHLGNMEKKNLSDSDMYCPSFISNEGKGSRY
jgi:hypothetical protein